MFGILNLRSMLKYPIDGLIFGNKAIYYLRLSKLIAESSVLRWFSLMSITLCSVYKSYLIIFQDRLPFKQLGINRVLISRWIELESILSAA